MKENIFIKRPMAAIAISILFSMTCASISCFLISTVMRHVFLFCRMAVVFDIRLHMPNRRLSCSV